MKWDCKIMGHSVWHSVRGRLRCVSCNIDIDNMSDEELENG